MSKISKNITNYGINAFKNLSNKVKKIAQKEPDVKMVNDLEADVLSKKTDVTEELKKLTSDATTKNPIIKFIEAINEIILG